MSRSSSFTLSDFKYSLSSLSVFDKIKWLAVVAVLVSVVWVLLFVAMYSVKTKVGIRQPDGKILRPVVFANTVKTTEHDGILIERPLFWPERRPPPEIVKVGRAKPAPKKVNRNVESFELLGVLGASESSVVNINYKGKMYRLRIGESLAGWTLEEVIGDGARFVESATQNTDNVVRESLLMYPKVDISPSWPREYTEFNNDN
ncbi:hypothetical protein QWI17_05235 [Gilvimarinus sp. SDUM040013]|uniref:Uncharacterized protein n=1 Tax=Gilvimarinus gilvus TaxID=3058038 RepID=A0ABU4RWH7_9GAMM|nr:hypothetical protein [Gilvimarinus sp. SDUM040013]MDO3385240.1 hypothetical protein [Gilvimarinus sp. SDUM040013]MDX6849223.1 hypothetical protein [Gilvimarinus sp. SDUM040013]